MSTRAGKMSGWVYLGFDSTIGQVPPNIPAGSVSGVILSVLLTAENQKSESKISVKIGHT
jgi:mannose/fructose/N-acetylgalactosamine-specific phosphotransferase system component IIC